jgi:hypothetical protein
MKEKLETGVCLAGLLGFLYVAAYFALARHGVTYTLGGKWAACPHYIGLPDSAEVCFRSLHNWDRTFLRRRFWAGTIPREQQLLAAEAALKAARAATKQQ